jgi:hypothetical protein
MIGVAHGLNYLQKQNERRSTVPLGLLNDSWTHLRGAQSSSGLPQQYPPAAWLPSLQSSVLGAVVAYGLHLLLEQHPQAVVVLKQIRVGIDGLAQFSGLTGPHSPAPAPRSRS